MRQTCTNTHIYTLYIRPVNGQVAGTRLDADLTEPLVQQTVLCIDDTHPTAHNGYSTQTNIACLPGNKLLPSLHSTAILYA